MRSATSASLLVRVLTGACACLLTLTAPRAAHAWGFAAHRLSEQRAIAGLPPGPLKDLLTANADWVVEHAVDPDLWRTTGVPPNEFPGHFLDMDAFGSYPFNDIPDDEAEHLRRHGANAAEKGRLPWRLAEAYDDLVDALRARDAERVLRAASTVGHYLGDAHVPLHAVTNYDGQLTGQVGVHARWEDDLIDRNASDLRLRLRPVRVTQPPAPAVFALKTLRASFLAAAPLLAADKACRGTPAAAGGEPRYDGAYFTCFYRRERNSLVTRLSDTSSTIASFWQAAWLAAGSPALDPRLRHLYVRGQSKAILATIDGAPGPLIDDAVRRGVMPNLAALRARGVRSSQVGVSQPAKTAPGHASLYTGAWPDEHGIKGNEFVPAGAALDESISGFASTGLRAEPLWVTAAGQGLRVTVAQATQVSPFAPYFDDKRFGGNFSRNLTLIDGFQAFDAPDALLRGRDADCGAANASWTNLPAHAGALRECRLPAGGATVFALLYDDPKRAGRGYDSMLLSPDRNARGRSVVHPDPLQKDASAFGQVGITVASGPAGAFFRLYDIAKDGSDFLLYRARIRMLKASRPRLDAAALLATGGTSGNGAIELYRTGALGTLLWDGGDGTAENRYLETVALTARQSQRVANFAAHQAPWELLITYLAYPDEALHLWLGRMDKDLAHHDPVLAARLAPYVDQALRIVDGYVGELLTEADAKTIVAIATDHGLAGFDRIFRPNVALAAAGLLAVDKAGALDLARTQAVYSPSNSGYVSLNRVSRPKGIVADADAARVVTDVGKALAQARDDGGRPLVVKTWVAGDDVYLDMAPGVQTSGALSGALFENAAPFGDHLYGPERPEMHGAFSMAGPGVPAGDDLGPLRQVDVAPTLCHLLGLDPPKNAVGAVVEAALSRKEFKP